MDYINNLLKEGFCEIGEEYSPIIFNVSKPRYFKNGDIYAVAGTDGFTLTWDDSKERNSILNDEVITAVLNPGNDKVEDEE